MQDKELANYSSCEYLAPFGLRHGNHVLPPIRTGASGNSPVKVCCAALWLKHTVLSVRWNASFGTFGKSTNICYCADPFLLS